MKKKLIIILFLYTIFSIIPVYASTNTKERTEEDYLIPNDIQVTESNKRNILLTPKVDENEKIYDFADLFTPSEEENLYSEITKYINSSNLDLAVVTINENNKSTPREYADDFYDYNNFGINNSKDGILFLIDMQNREIYMATTGYAINMYDDYRINKSLDEVYKYMSDQNYYQGTLNYINIIDKYAKSGLPSTKDKKSLSKTILYSLIIAIIITLIIMIILIKKNKLVKQATTAKEYLKRESIIMNNLGEILISTNTIKTEIDHSSGGSSIHTGSSGNSHGGGGHGF